MSSDRPSIEACAYFERRFGVDRATLAELHFHQRGDDIWAVSAAAPIDVVARRPPGLRVLRRPPHGLKPTTALLIHLGTRITASRVEVDLDRLEALLLGRRLDTDQADGFVALSYRGDVVGCGRIGRGLLQAMIPTGRRRELLIALAERSNVEPA